MTKHIPKKARKGVTRDRARELDVKALARSAGLNFDGVALTSAGLVLLADSAGAAPLTKAPAEHGHPRGGKDQLASSTTSSTTSDGASAATRSPGHDVAAAAAVTKPVALDQSAASVRGGVRQRYVPVVDRQPDRTRDGGATPGRRDVNIRSLNRGGFWLGYNCDQWREPGGRRRHRHRRRRHHRDGRPHRLHRR